MQFEPWNVISLLIGALSAYYGAKQATAVAIARLEEQLKALKERVDSDHVRLDDHIQASK